MRVLIVDDSRLTCRIIAGALASEPAIDVVGHATSGRAALDEIETRRPDVVTLDLEMPGWDGLETLKQIRSRHPEVRVIMFSSLTGPGAPATVKALILGASDYAIKPQADGGGTDLTAELVRKILQFRAPALSAPAPSATPRRQSANERAPFASGSLRPRPLERARAVLIAVSTGGPQALASVIPAFPADFPLPILVVQHMPPSFTGPLAERLGASSALRVEEAVDGRQAEPGLVLLAPGGRHLTVESHAGVIRARLTNSAPENGCRPAADVLFRSAAKVWGGDVIAAVLTGMGRDGTAGVRELKPLGAWVIAQDAASSIVWGMPGCVVNDGLADEVLGLDQIAPAILRKVRGAL